MRRFSWWLLPDSNWGHKALQASALPTELKSHTIRSGGPLLYYNSIALLRSDELKSRTPTYFTRGDEFFQPTSYSTHSRCAARRQ